MSSALSYEIRGLDRLLKKTSPDLLRAPFRRMFERISIAAQNRARQNAPVDTGRLRASIAYEIDKRDLPLFTRIGTNVFYAPYMEFGTGLFAEGEGGKGGRHYPPPAALDLWASRHGFASGAQVAWSIGKRGGLKPRRYLRNALKESAGDIRAAVARCGEEIRTGWDGK